MAATDWTSGSTKLGKSKKAPAKTVHEVRTRKGKTGGFIHEHHHTDPMAHPMEEHTSPNDQAMAQHMMDVMGGQGGAAAAANPNPAAAAAGADMGAPQPGAAAGGPPPQM